MQKVAILSLVIIAVWRYGTKREEDAPKIAWHQ
jgi:hypothetical protein